MGFQILPQSHRDSINTIELIDQGRIMGYDTYNSIMSHKKSPDSLIDDANSEYYNVTLNFVVKRQSQYQADMQHKSYLAQVAQGIQPQQQEAIQIEVKQEKQDREKENDQMLT